MRESAGPWRHQDRWRRMQTVSIERRADRAEILIHMETDSAAWHALDGGCLTPDDTNTFREL